MEAEQETNRQEALRRFCDPALGKRFYDELCAGLAKWQGRPLNGDAGAGLSARSPAASHA